jgi:FkbM family methyltransferase
MPPVIIDAGANVGLCAVFYANRFPDARIIAIEPEPSNYEMLKKNTAPYPNITTVHAALWKENGPLRLFDTGEGTLHSRSVKQINCLRQKNAAPCKPSRWKS